MRGGGGRGGLQLKDNRQALGDFQLACRNLETLLFNGQVQVQVQQLWSSKKMSSDCLHPWQSSQGPPAEALTFVKTCCSFGMLCVDSICSTSSSRCTCADTACELRSNSKAAIQIGGSRYLWTNTAWGVRAEELLLKTANLSFVDESTLCSVEGIASLHKGYCC